ncbi:MAG: hypothetical protein AAF138_02125 [Planctomycetota bacterium]
MIVRTNMAAAAIMLLLAGIGAAWLRFAPAPEAAAPPAPIALVTNEVIEQLEAVELLDADGAVLEGIRRGAVGGWVVRSGSGDAEGPAWPVQSERLQGFLSLMSRLRATPVDDASVSGSVERAPQRGLRLVSGGGTRTIWLGDEVGGGEGLLWLDDGGEVLRCASTAHVLARSGFEPWRSGVAGPRPSGRASGVRLSFATGGVLLHRTRDGWWVREPTEARAAEAAAQAVLDAMARSEVLAWDASAAEGEPIASVQVLWTSDASPGSGTAGSAVDTLVQTLDVLAAGDAQNKSVVVRSELRRGQEMIWGPSLLRVDAERFFALPGAVDGYLSRRAVRSPMSTLTSVDVRGSDGAVLMRYERVASGWRAADGSEFDASSLERALNAWTEDAAVWASVSTPEDLTGLRCVVGLGIGGSESGEVLELYRSASGPVVRAGARWLRYDPAALPLGGWAP